MNSDEIRQHVIDFLRRLLEVGSALREAMLARNPDQIQAVVAQQDELLRSVPPSTTDMAEDEDVKALAQKLQRLQQSNRLLASSFARLYEGTMKQVLGTPESNAGAYHSAGRRAYESSAPLLVSQTG